MWYAQRLGVQQSAQQQMDHSALLEHSLCPWLDHHLARHRKCLELHTATGFIDWPSGGGVMRSTHAWLCRAVYGHMHCGPINNRLAAMREETYPC